MLLGKKLGEDPVVSEDVKGVSKANPDLPHYTDTWDPALISSWCTKAGPNAGLDYYTLVGKVGVLLALTGLRGGDQMNINLEISKIPEICGNCMLACTSKEAKLADKGYIMQEVEAVPSNALICPWAAVHELMHRRPKKADPKTFFVLVKGTPMSRDWLRKCMKKVMLAAGIPDEFKPHSCRVAGASKALEAKVPEAIVRHRFRWSMTSRTFDLHYNRAKPDLPLAQAVLEGAPEAADPPPISRRVKQLTAAGKPKKSHHKKK
jgi:hypothetical protein